MGRTTEYVGGPKQTASRAEVVAAWEAVTGIVPSSYALGTAEHESNFAINELDTEESGFQSKGIFQISDEEAAGEDPYTLEGSCSAFARISETRYSALLAAGAAYPDILGFLAIAHNRGLSVAVRCVTDNGGSWDTFKQNDKYPLNWHGGLKQVLKTIRYGEDCMSGGSVINKIGGGNNLVGWLLILGIGLAFYEVVKG